MKVFDDWSDEKRARARDVLRKALKIISVNKRWAKNTLAADAYGISVPLRSVRAVAFCAIGAVYKVGGKGDVDAIRALDDMGELAIIDVNDTRGHAAVLKRFRKTIAALAPEKKR